MKTRLTEMLGIKHPVIQAPMAFAAGGALAAAATKGGALGMIGGGYGDPEWIDAQFNIAGAARIGCGFITWRLAEQPTVLDRVLERQPAAVFLSFGNPAPYVDRILGAGAALICQVQTLKDARHAMDVGAQIIVAQGGEAGGHGEGRGTLTLVPEIADEIARRNTDIALVAAGGIADGRGLAASVMLGADGVVVGTRYWASGEALVHPRILADSLHASGDDTIRTRVLDIVRGYDWPQRYSVRARKNEFVEKWHDAEAGLRRDLGPQTALWDKANTQGDPSIAAAFVGEGLGLIHNASPAEGIAAQIVEQAAALLLKAGS